MPPEKKPPRKKPPRKLPPSPEKSPQENCPPTLQKRAPRKNAPRTIAPRIVYQIFIAFDITLRLFLLKLFIVPTILVMIFWHFLIISLRSESPQVQRYLISSIKNLVHELPNKFPNDLRPRILGNQEISEKCQIYEETQRLVPSLPSRNQTLTIVVKKHTKLDITFLKSF